VTAIRPATGADAGGLAALRWEFRAGRERPTEDQAAFLARCGEWMRRELDIGSWRAWVAERDGRIVGQVWLQVIGKVPNPVGERAKHAYLSNLYVQPAARGGVGTRLLETAIDWAAAHGVDRLLLWPAARSISLYERHGFSRDGDVMELRCGQGISPPRSESST
jgi:GNAT superfamily N-acetyltransferase